MARLDDSRIAMEEVHVASKTKISAERPALTNTGVPAITTAKQTWNTPFLT